MINVLIYLDIAHDPVYFVESNFRYQRVSIKSSLHAHEIAISSWPLICIHTSLNKKNSERRALFFSHLSLCSGPGSYAVTDKRKTNASQKLHKDGCAGDVLCVSSLNTETRKARALNSSPSPYKRREDKRKEGR